MCVSIFFPFAPIENHYWVCKRIYIAVFVERKKKKQKNVHALSVPNAACIHEHVFVHFLYDSSPRSNCERNKFNITAIKEHTIIRL